MVWVCALGNQRRSCETRLALDGVGYELVITEETGIRTEQFSDISRLLSREHELFAAWRAQGWREPSRWQKLRHRHRLSRIAHARTP